MTKVQQELLEALPSNKDWASLSGKDLRTLHLLSLGNFVEYESEKVCEKETCKGPPCKHSGKKWKVRAHITEKGLSFLMNFK